MGNRIAKHIYSAVGAWEKSTFYVRDASGNVMATYEETIELVNIDLDPELEEVIDYDCIERPIYGSSRLGMETTLIEMVEADSPSSTDAKRILGYKQYELSNHLGNVLAVVNDMKLPDFNGTLIVSYTAVVVSATDYSPFGVGLYGRSWSSEVYRYGFNGKEKDSENFEGAYDFGARIYDGRLGRWLSVDPHSANYPNLSGYCINANSPLAYVDIDGKDIFIFFYSQDQSETGVGHTAIGVGSDVNNLTYFTHYPTHEGEPGGAHLERNLTFSDASNYDVNHGLQEKPPVCVLRIKTSGGVDAQVIADLESRLGKEWKVASCNCADGPGKACELAGLDVEPEGALWTEEGAGLIASPNQLMRTLIADNQDKFKDGTITVESGSMGTFLEQSQGPATLNAVEVWATKTAPKEVGNFVSRTARKVGSFFNDIWQKTKQGVNDVERMFTNPY